MVRIKAPELPSTYPWLNSEPLSLQALRGRIVLLDFWTYCCINCLHILPDLHYLEQKYIDSLTVIGVHSGKFDHEQNVEAIRQAILRYDIEHPIVVDRNFQIWQQYVVRAYPTLVVIDPQGYIVGQVSGEGHRDRLDELIGKLIQDHQAKGTIDFQALSHILEKQRQPIESPLAFPGKVLADSDCLYVADSGHHRIVIADHSGNVKQIIGTGTAGYQDGSFAEAQFSAPQGLALDPQTQSLYIADTDNHTIRCADLQQQTVKTIAGTGQQNRQLRPQHGALQTPLNSPWDLVLVDRVLFVAMAGSHQIWAIDLQAGELKTYAGTGAEACVDGDIDQAAFAQPSSIATNGQELFVADSEGSTIRAVSLAASPTVRSVCGSGDLYGFGDRDGQGEAVRLQHCLGVAMATAESISDAIPRATSEAIPRATSGNYLWIADTYNHKIKRVQVESGRCETVLGGLPGLQDGRQAQFNEPAGLSAIGSQLYVADTNNHAIRRVDLKTLEVETIAFPKLCAPDLCFPL
ncbi:redoxin domain-containing protein [Phormidium tenue FACHB-886]|nr:redoxin domain-containing protein [Phormidium tenue FACHB-886]